MQQRVKATFVYLDKKSCFTLTIDFARISHHHSGKEKKYHSHPNKFIYI